MIPRAVGRPSAEQSKQRKGARSHERHQNSQHAGHDPEEWLALRRKGIGGSDAGAILGLLPWASPLSVYCDKMGLTPEREDNEAMRQGRDLEEYVAQRFV